MSSALMKVRRIVEDEIHQTMQMGGTDFLALERLRERLRRENLWPLTVEEGEARKAPEKPREGGC